jgi:hypothetical protein
MASFEVKSFGFRACGPDKKSGAERRVEDGII